MKSLLNAVRDRLSIWMSRPISLEEAVDRMDNALASNSLPTIVNTYFQMETTLGQAFVDKMAQHRLNALLPGSDKYESLANFTQVLAKLNQNMGRPLAIETNSIAALSMVDWMLIYDKLSIERSKRFYHNPAQRVTPIEFKTLVKETPPALFCDKLSYARVHAGWQRWLFGIPAAFLSKMVSGKHSQSWQFATICGISLAAVATSLGALIVEFFVAVFDAPARWTPTGYKLLLAIHTTLGVALSLWATVPHAQSQEHVLRTMLPRTWEAAITGNDIGSKYFRSVLIYFCMQLDAAEIPVHAIQAVNTSPEEMFKVMLQSTGKPPSYYDHIDQKHNFAEIVRCIQNSQSPAQQQASRELLQSLNDAFATTPEPIKLYV